MPSLAQSPVTNGHGGSQSLTVTLGSATTAGNCLVVCISAWNAVTSASVSGITLGGSADNFAKADSALGGSSDAEIWTDQNCAGGLTSVVITTTGGSAPNSSIIATVYEVSGAAASGAVDQVNHGTGTATSWSSGPTGTTSNAAEIWFGVFAGVDSSNSRTVAGPPSPWTNTSASTVSIGGIEAGYFISGEQIVSSTGTSTYAGTQNDSGGMHWAAVTITLAGLSTVSGSAAAAGAGTVSAVAQSGSGAPLTSAGALTAAGAVTAAASLAASTAIAAKATVSGSASLAGASATAALGISFSGELAEMDGAGSLTALPSVSSSAPLGSASALTASAIVQPVASLAAVSGLTASGCVKGSVTMTGRGALAGSGVSTVIAGVAGSGSVSAFATVRVKASLTGAGVISANEGQPGVASLASSSALSAHAQPFTPASLAATSAVTASGSVVTHYRHRWGRAPEYVSLSGAVMQ